MTTQCKAEDCNNNSSVRGMCHKHYMRYRRNGTVENTRPKNWGKKNKHHLYHTWGHIKKKRGLLPIDQRWMDDFFVFAEEVGDRPSNDHKLTLIDSETGYFKNNVFWKSVVGSQYDLQTKEGKAEWQRHYRKKKPERHHHYDLRRNYRSSGDEYKKLLKKQNGCCAI